jgi:hypothetical protein
LAPVTRCDGGKGAATLSDLGTSKNQSATWQQLAAVPEDQFAAALGGPKKPTTTGIKTSNERASQFAFRCAAPRRSISSSTS